MSQAQPGPRILVPRAMSCAPRQGWGGVPRSRHGLASVKAAATRHGPSVALARSRSPCESSEAGSPRLQAHRPEAPWGTAAEMPTACARTAAASLPPSPASAASPAPVPGPVPVPAECRCRSGARTPSGCQARQGEMPSGAPRVAVEASSRQTAQSWGPVVQSRSARGHGNGETRLQPLQQREPAGCRQRAVRASRTAVECSQHRLRCQAAGVAGAGPAQPQCPHSERPVSHC